MTGDVILSQLNQDVSVPDVFRTISNFTGDFYMGYLNGTDGSAGSIDADCASLDYLIPFSLQDIDNSSVTSVILPGQQSITLGLFLTSLTIPLGVYIVYKVFRSLV